MAAVKLQKSVVSQTGKHTVTTRSSALSAIHAWQLNETQETRFNWIKCC